MKGQLATLRMFLRFGATIDTVGRDPEEKILLPKTTEDDARDRMLNAERAREILDVSRNSCKRQGASLAR
jgi:hypothetical protein